MVTLGLADYAGVQALADCWSSSFDRWGKFYNIAQHHARCVATNSGVVYIPLSFEGQNGQVPHVLVQ